MRSDSNNKIFPAIPTAGTDFTITSAGLALGSVKSRYPSVKLVTNPLKIPHSGRQGRAF
jgi:hypothetical protein